MKKLFTVLAAVLITTSHLFGAAGDIKIPQRNSTNTAWPDIIIPTVPNSFLGTDGTGKLTLLAGVAGTGSVTSIPDGATNGINWTVASRTSVPTFTFSLGDVPGSTVAPYTVSQALGGLVLAGLVPDSSGAAAANSVVIQKAFPTGIARTVVLPHGTFYISTGIVIAPGSRLLGQGGQAGDLSANFGTVLIYTGTGIAVTCTGGLGWDFGLGSGGTNYAGGAVKDIRFGGTSAASGTNAGGIRFTDVDNFIIENCSFEGFSAGFAIQGRNVDSYSENAQLHNNRIHGCKWGIWAHIEPTISSQPGIAISNIIRYRNRSFSNWSISDHHTAMYIDGETLLKVDDWGQFYGGMIRFKNGMAYATSLGGAAKSILIDLGADAYISDALMQLYSENNSVERTYTRLKMGARSLFSGTGFWAAAPTAAMSAFVNATTKVDDIDPTATWYEGPNGEIRHNRLGPAMLRNGEYFTQFKTFSTNGEYPIAYFTGGIVELNISYFGTLRRHNYKITMAAGEGSNIIGSNPKVSIEPGGHIGTNAAFNEGNLPYLRFTAAGNPILYVDINNGVSDGYMSVTGVMSTFSNTGSNSDFGPTKPLVLFPDTSGLTMAAKSVFGRYNSLNRILVPANNAIEASDSGAVTFTATGGAVISTNTSDLTNLIVNFDAGDMKSTQNLSTLTDPVAARANLGLDNFGSHGVLGATPAAFDTRQGWHFGILDVNTTLSFSNWAATGNARTIYLELKQDATGGWNVVGWPAAVVVPPLLNPAANATTIVTLSTRDGGTTIHARSSYSAGGGGGSGTVTSVAATVPSFLSVSGSPITTGGTLSFSYSGTPLPLTAGGTGGGSAAAARTSLGLATVAATGSAADLTGNLAVARLNSGTSASGSTYWRGDGTWATPSGAGTVTSSGTPTSGQIAEFTTATNVQGVAVTGTGAVVRQNAPSLTGVVTTSGANDVTFTDMSADVLDVTLANSKTISADRTFTLSGTPSATDRFIPLKITNSSGSTKTITLPAGTWKSAADGSTITNVTVAAGVTTLFTIQYVGSTTYLVYAPSAGGGGGGGSGTVTSVAASVPSFLSISGSPVTTSGTLAMTLSGTALPITSGGTGGITPTAARVALGNDNYQAHGNSGSTEAFTADTAWHSVTLDQNSTFSFTNWPATGTSARTIILEILQDATGSRTVTWTGVASPPAIDPTASATTIVTLSTRDGGTTILAQSTYVTGGSVGVTQQDHTTGATVTVTNGTAATLWLDINPASTLAAVTVTLPATPVDSQVVSISAGGTVTSGTVVTALTISPNTSQAILQATTPTNMEAGETISYRWKASTAKWMRL